MIERAFTADNGSILFAGNAGCLGGGKASGALSCGSERKGWSSRAVHVLRVCHVHDAIVVTSHLEYTYL